MDQQNRAARKKHHFIYKTTCLITGKYYVGMHSTDDLADGYMGSGKRLWQSLKKHGAEQHRCEVLEHLPSREALRLREAQLVDEQLLQDPLCMNLTTGGEGSWDHLNTPEAVERRRPTFVAWHRAGNKAFCKKYENDPGFNAKQKANLAKATVKATELRPLTNPNGCFYGHKHTDEARKLMSEAKKRNPTVNPSAGKPWMHHPELQQARKVDPTEVDNLLLAGWLKGRKMYQK